MGNRSFFYLVDRLPGADDDEPEIECAVGESNNSMPPVFQVLLAVATAGQALDFQQVFLPSSVGGLYAERVAAEARLFKLLDFLAAHPRLQDGAAFSEACAALRRQFASLPGAAYSGDVNEYLHLIGDSDDAALDQLAGEFADRWRDAEQAMQRADHAAIDRIYELDPRDMAGTLGFQCLDLDYALDHSGGDGSCAGHELYRFIEDGRFGLRKGSAQGKIVLPALYERIDSYEDGTTVAVITRDGKQGLVDHNGVVRLEPQIDEIFGFSENVAVARMDGRYGYIDNRGRWLTTPQFDDAYDFQHGRANVILRGLNGYVGKDGRLAVPAQYQDGRDFSEHGAMVQTAQGWGLIDQDGAPLIAPQFDDIDQLEADESLYLVRKDGKAGLWSGHGKQFLLPCAYDGVTAFTVDEASYVLAFQPGSVSLWFSVDQYRKERRYEWIECQDRAALDEDTLLELADYISSEWDDGEAIYCKRDSNGWRLFENGDEWPEWVHQARVAETAAGRARDAELVERLAVILKTDVASDRRLAALSEMLEPQEIISSAQLGEFLEMGTDTRMFRGPDGEALKFFFTGRIYLLCAEVAEALGEDCTRHIELAMSSFRQMRKYDFGDADIMLARCYLGKYGGSVNPAQAREHLARARTVTRNQVEADALLAFLDWQGSPA